ncbi:MAG: hypothetical protein CMM26_03250 [Rhodospirillaceae bacterium]|nr:hypothetical protein [Rhodospirillaceae bacterium]|tara:strand:+ start:148 stop:375 length:228 start_codon:yes stop_codon:yes gene_type:complete
MTGLAILVATAALTSTAQATEAIEKFFVNHVGAGTAIFTVEYHREVRDLDVTVERYKNEDFTLTWITAIRYADAG